MSSLESDFYCSEAALVRQVELEQQTKEISRRLDDNANQLKWLAHAESLSQIRSIQSKTQSLYRYCSGMSEVINEMLLDMRSVARSTQVLLDDAMIEIQEITRGISKE